MACRTVNWQDAPFLFFDREEYGKGMRVVRSMDGLVELFNATSSEALASFGDGSVFVERFVERPRHSSQSPRV